VLLPIRRDDDTVMPINPAYTRVMAPIPIVVGHPVARARGVDARDSSQGDAAALWAISVGL
jgi:hypothetical protein